MVVNIYVFIVVLNGHVFIQRKKGNTLHLNEWGFGLSSGSNVPRLSGFQGPSDGVIDRTKQMFTIYYSSIRFKLY